MRRLGWLLLLLSACSSRPAPSAAPGAPPDAGSDAAPFDAAPADAHDAAAAPTASVVSKSEASYQETYAVIARAKNGVLAVAWMGYHGDGTSAMGYSFSSDDGASWSAPSQITTPGHDASDQAIVADDAGNFYLAWLGLPSFAPADQYYADRVYLARAAAGESAFGTPVLVSDDSLHLLYDRAWIAKTASGAILVTFNRRPDNLSTSPNTIAAVRSTNGVDWTGLTLASGAGYRNQAYSCGVGTNGRLFVLYRGSEEGYLVLRWSDDDGVTWPSANLSQVLASNQHVEFDPSCVVRGDDVWVLYSRGTPDSTLAAWKSISIDVVHSTNGGQSFGDPVEALDPAGPQYAQKATLALDPAGALLVAYYAGEKDDDPDGSLRFVRSTDAGASFSASEVIAKDPFTVPRGGYRWFGDYMTAIAPANELFVAYVDTTEDYGHVAVARQPLP